jgi:trk system potassium uptake protein TrkH
MLNFQAISNVVGVLLIILGFFMYLCLPVSYIYQSGDAGDIFKAGSVTVLLGIAFWKYNFRTTGEKLSKREGYFVVAFSWIMISIFSALPYQFSGVTHNFADALFESVSGLTTTGASIFTDIEALPQGILFWRSMTHWIGGMGIIVLTIAVFPLLGVAGIELFTAESPGPTTDKIHPKIKETAKRLWGLYVLLTIICALVYWLEGMSLFDAVNHSFATLATGGFSTKNASAAAFGPTIQYTMIFFMLLAGCNYFVIYSLMKGKWQNIMKNEEFRFYLGIVFFFILTMTIGVYARTDLGFESSFRYVSFTVISLITTTGFVSYDYTLWGFGLTSICFLLLFIGACAGSTAGGIKIIRHIVFIKNSYLEFKRILHPRAVIRIKISKEIVAPKILTHILVFLLIYIGVFISGMFALAVLEYDLLTAAGASATCLGNVGPGVGGVGPVFNFAFFNSTAKYILSFIMVIGRLELFTVLILFTPYYWKVN